MKKAISIIATLFVAYCGAARAESTVSYAVEPSRFDFVALISVDGEHDSPFLRDGFDGKWDMIICNQSAVDGGGTINGSNFLVHAHVCRARSEVKSIQLNHNTNSPWYGTIYARWH